MKGTVKRYADGELTISLPEIALSDEQAIMLAILLDEIGCEEEADELRDAVYVQGPAVKEPKPKWQEQECDSP